MQVHSPLIHRRHRIRPLFWVLLALQIIALPVEAQNAGQNIIKGVIIGGAIIAASQANKKKAQAAKNGQNNNNPNAINGKAADTSAVAAFNAKPAATLVAANMDDATGTWDGEVADPNTVWHYTICLTRIGDNMYSGVDSFQIERMQNNSPIPQGTFHGRQTFIAKMSSNAINFSDAENVDGQKFAPLNEQLRFVMDGNSPVLINNNKTQPNRKLYLKKVSPTLPDYLARYAVGPHSLGIGAITYKNSKGGPMVEYNDRGVLNVALTSTVGRDLGGIQVKVAVLENDNGVINPNGLNGGPAIPKNGVTNFWRNLNTNFSIPRDSIHFLVTLAYQGVDMTQKKVAFSTDPFYKADQVVTPSYNSPRLQAVGGFYGYLNTPYAETGSQLEPLVTGGDKIAAMWRAVFLSMGYGGYKIDEEQGYTLGKTCIRAVEEKARKQDAEALYLLFYACQMGLEGDNARQLSVDFLQRAADAGFKPAVYDYALQYTLHKNYPNAFRGLVASYGLGVKKAAKVIGDLYEKGLGAPNDNDSAIFWYRAGMSFGDPEATLAYANMVAKGYGDNPPDINKALTLAAGAAAKNCTAAMIFSGTVYLNGKQGIAQNAPSAIKWFKAGAERGDRQAMLALGETYMADIPGMTKDLQSGFYWIRKAALVGSPKAMLVLAECYNEGIGTEKNTIVARYWYNQAVLNGYAKADATGLNANTENFMNFWKYADFSPSYVYVNEYGDRVGDSDDGLMNGLFSGLAGSMFSYYSNHQELIDGLEFITKKNGVKIYGGTVSSHFVSNLFLRQGVTATIHSYGIVSTGYMSGPATADGLGNAWAEYRIVPNIPCSAVMTGVKDSQWQFIGQYGVYTAPKDGPLLFALNAIDYRNYKGYFDIVVQVPE